MYHLVKKQSFGSFGKAEVKALSQLFTDLALVPCTEAGHCKGLALGFNIQHKGFIQGKQSSLRGLSIRLLSHNTLQQLLA